MFSANRFDLPIQMEKRTEGTHLWLSKKKKKQHFCLFPDLKETLSIMQLAYVPFCSTKLFIVSWIWTYTVVSAQENISVLNNILLFSCSHLSSIVCPPCYSFLFLLMEPYNILPNVWLTIQLDTGSAVSWRPDWKCCVLEVGQTDERISRLKSELPCCKSDVLAQHYDQPCQLDGPTVTTCYSMFQNELNLLCQVSMTPEACLQLLVVSPKVFFCGVVLYVIHSLKVMCYYTRLKSPSSM